MHPSSFEMMGRFVEKHVRLRKGLRVLDVGGADINGSYRPIFKGAEYVTLDVRGSGANVEVDGRDWPFEEASFDVIVSGQTLEHDPKFWLTLESMKRVVKPGGLVVIIVPSQGSVHRHPVDCYRFLPDFMTLVAELLGTTLADLEWSREVRWGDLGGVFRIPKVSTLHVVIQTCPARRERLPETIATVEASDIDSWEVMEHPEGSTLWEFFSSVVQRLSECGADYGVRLEDDAAVSPYFQHNALSWPALDEPDFGAGWLFSSQAILKDTRKQGKGRLTGTPFRSIPFLHCSLAVMFPTLILPELRGIFDGIRSGQDLTMSRGVWESGRRCYFHVPTLAENRMWPSARNHHNHTKFGHCAGPYFDPEYRRRI